MNDTILLTIASSLVATLFGLLVAVLAWIGNKIYTKLDDLNNTMLRVESDLHGRITDLDRRVTRVEERQEIFPCK